MTSSRRTPDPEVLAQWLRERFEQIQEEAMALGSKDRIDVVMPRIMCAKCEKPVDRVEREQYFMSDTVRFKVWCHGETDSCELTQHDLQRFGDRLEPGYAFTKERLPEAGVEGAGRHDQSSTLQTASERSGVHRDNGAPKLLPRQRD